MTAVSWGPFVSSVFVRGVRGVSHVTWLLEKQKKEVSLQFTMQDMH